MSIEPPPINDILAEQNGLPSIRWILFFNQVFNGDAGTDWTPTFVSLGSTGTPTFSGRYYRLSQFLVYYRVTITPATDITSTAGTTYIDNFPLRFSADGACLAMRGGEGTVAGHSIASNNRIYIPPFSAVTVPLTIVGMGEAA